MTLREQFPYYLANRAETPNADLEVKDKFTGEIVTRVALATPEVLDKAIAAAVEAAPALRETPSYQRRAALDHCANFFTQRADELARVLCAEAGKPIRDSRGEVDRLIETFRVAAEESVRQQGEIMPLDRIPRAKGYTGFIKRVPLGPCALITPFNFPLNLAAHKIAPAIAAGCPFILKPASYTPLGALIIGEILADADLPTGAFSILPCRASDAAALVEDERIKLLSFTGSAEVGWSLKSRAGKKKVALELGGNAGCIIEPDADLEDVVKRLVFGAFYQSGQSCISVQRIYAHEDIYEGLRDRLAQATRALKSGSPLEEETFIGPVISEADAIRIEDWVQSAVKRGATLLCGGTRNGPVVEATLLEGVPEEEALVRQEVFGPVAILDRYRDFDEALAAVNRSEFGLQAGVFTRDIYKAHRAWDRLEVGGVVINDVPSWRADQMPYGGVKNSGQGREGIRWSIEEMTEIRLMVLRTP